MVFGADVWASDWNPMTPEAELALLMGRIDKAGRGIVLLHDTKAQTARMLPALAADAEKARLPHRPCGAGHRPANPELAASCTAKPREKRHLFAAGREKSLENKPLRPFRWLIFR